MVNRVLNSITEGRYWVLKSLVVVTLASFLFSCAPAVLFFRPASLPPAYQLKSERPFADTARLQVPDDPGERSHGAKLTPRLFSSVILFLATKLSLHPYVPATIGGLLYLLSGIVVGYRLTDDRAAGLWIGMILAGLYATNACFSMNFAPKPFDGIAIGMVAVTMMLIDRPWLLGASAYLTCWTDERAILSLGLIALVIIAMRDPTTARRRPDSPKWRGRCGVLAAAIVVYVVTRSMIAQSLQWSSADMSMLGQNLLGAFTFSQLAAWTCFEGGWILIAMAIGTGWKKGATVQCVLIAASALASVASCLIVLDVSRAGAFAFPLILAAIGFLATEANQSAGESMLEASLMRRAVGVAAAISLLATNFEVIAWTVVQPLPSTPIAILSGWINF